MLFPYSTEFVPRKIDTKLKDYESSDNEHILWKQIVASKGIAWNFLGMSRTPWQK